MTRHCRDTPRRFARGALGVLLRGKIADSQLVAARRPASALSIGRIRKIRAAPHIAVDKI